MVQTGWAQWRSGIAEAGRTFCGSQVRLLVPEFSFTRVRHVFRPSQLFRRSERDASERTHEQQDEAEPNVPPP